MEAEMETEVLERLRELAKKNEMTLEDYEKLANLHERLIKDVEELAKKCCTKDEIAKAINVIAKGLALIDINVISVPDLMSACSGPTYHDAFVSMIAEEVKALKKLIETLRNNL